MIIYFKASINIGSQYSKKQISDVILSELKKRDVDSIIIKENGIIFKYKFWKAESAIKTINYVDKGVFCINVQNEVNIITYQSSTSFIFDLILILFFLALGVFFKSFFILGSLLITFQVLLRLAAIKSADKLLIKKIMEHFPR